MARANDRECARQPIEMPGDFCDGEFGPRCWAETMEAEQDNSGGRGSLVEDEVTEVVVGRQHDCSASEGFAQHRRVGETWTGFADGDHVKSVAPQLGYQQPRYVFVSYEHRHLCGPRDRENELGP